MKQEYTHIGKYYHIPCYYNINTGGIAGRNIVSSALLGAVIVLRYTFRKFVPSRDVVLIKELQGDDKWH